MRQCVFSVEHRGQDFGQIALHGARQLHGGFASFFFHRTGNVFFTQIATALNQPVAIGHRGKNRIGIL
jgi:hypothetical protein